MTVQYGVAVQNGRNNSVQTIVGTSPRLRVLTGAPPANCAAAQTGTLLVEMVLPVTWLNASAGGVITKAGTWQGTAVATGTASYYRIVDSTGVTCHEQGSVGLGSGDLSLDNTSIGTGQVVTVNTYQRTDGNP
jgi:hypothetical protein